MRIILIILFFVHTLIGATALELLGADFNSNRMIDGEILTTLLGNVEFQYGTMNIKSDSTIWRRGSGLLHLGGSVVVTRPNQILTCDSMFFTREIKMLELRGSMAMVDSSREVTITAREADFFLDVDSLELRYDPKVYFWSSSDTDTVVVTGEPMHYLGKSGIARVAENITIDGRNTHAVANSGFYSAELDEAELRGEATADYALSTLTGELIRLFITDQSADSFTVVQGTPLGITRDTVGADTTVNRLSGDSLHFTVDTNRIERVVSVGSSKMEQFSPEREGFADILWGNRIVANIRKGGDGNALSQGNARSLYRSDKDMQNEIAGDTLFLTYGREGVREITLTGGVQGVILPQESSE